MCSGKNRRRDVKQEGILWLVFGAGAAAAAWVAWRARSAGDAIAAIPDSGGGLGVLGRAVVGGGADAGSSSSRPAGASEVPTTKHSNLRRLRGAVLRPAPGTKVDVPLLASGYDVTLALSNDGDAPVTSPVTLDVQEDGFLGAGELVKTAPLTLLPGEPRVVTVRVPLTGSAPSVVDVGVDLRVYFDGFLLSRVSFERV